MRHIRSCLYFSFLYKTRLSNFCKFPAPLCGGALFYFIVPGVMHKKNSRKSLLPTSVARCRDTRGRGYPIAMVRARDLRATSFLPGSALRDPGHDTQPRFGARSVRVLPRVENRPDSLHKDPYPQVTGHNTASTFCYVSYFIKHQGSEPADDSFVADNAPSTFPKPARSAFAVPEVWRKSNLQSNGGDVLPPVA